MRVTSQLWRQHIGRMFKRHWYVQGQRKVEDMGIEEILAAKNIRVIDPNELLGRSTKKTKEQSKPLQFQRSPPDNLHSKQKNPPCFTYRDHNVLVEGVPQAEVLTKTVRISDDLPEEINKLNIDHDERIMKIVRRAVDTSNLYDAHQELLPKIKDPERPAWVFRRAYGLTALRRVHNVSQKLVHLCESMTGPGVTHRRNIIYNGVFSVPIVKDDTHLQFILRADMLITSSRPLKNFASQNDGQDIELPSLEPLLPTISMNKEDVYTLRNSYPVSGKSQWVNAHTIYAYYNPEEVKNIYETPVTESQILGRSLLKAFGVAAACARERFGTGIKVLPQPVTVQCVQSDGQYFHFSVFQLNTLDLNGTTGTKNVWWSLPRIKLYEQADYVDGIPTIKDYNPEVFKRIFAFHANN